MGNRPRTPGHPDLLNVFPARSAAASSPTERSSLDVSWAAEANALLTHPPPYQAFHAGRRRRR